MEHTNATPVTQRENGEPTQTQELREALAWALDVLDATDTYLKNIDPNYHMLNTRADNEAKAKARATLAKQAPPSATTKDKSLEKKEALATNLHILQNALTVLEPFARLAGVFDVEPYNQNYPDSLRVNGTGKNFQADVLRANCFLTLGDCRRARTVFQTIELLLSEHATKFADASGSPKSSSLSATTQAEGGPPPCALCSKPPHPDSCGHSYRPLEASSFTSGLSGQLAAVWRPFVTAIRAFH